MRVRHAVRVGRLGTYGEWGLRASYDLQLVVP